MIKGIINIITISFIIYLIREYGRDVCYRGWNIIANRWYLWILFVIFLCLLRVLIYRDDHREETKTDQRRDLLPFFLVGFIIVIATPFIICMIYGDESWYMYILVEKIIYDICLGITLTILKEDIEEDIEEF